MIFVNLPVTDLQRAKAFYAALGFQNNAQFPDETAAAMVIEENIVAMLLPGRSSRASSPGRSVTRRRPPRCSTPCPPAAVRRSTACTPLRWQPAASRGCRPRTTGSCTAPASPTRTATSGRRCGWTPPSPRAEAAVGGGGGAARYFGRVPVARPAVGYLLTVAAAALFAVNGTVSTLALQAGIPATRLTALRCTGAALALVLTLAVVSPARLRIRWRELPFVAVFGVVGIALTQFLYYVAIGRLPVGIALVFEMTAPVLIALYVWLVRREHVRSRLWIALSLSLSGLVLVAQVLQGGGSQDPPGRGAGLTGGVCLAG